ncbi:MAG: phytoene desaturase family protein, partial [Mycobacteriaceae bacterium]
STLGGGARTIDLGLAPGITHDLCSAVHPLALASPFFQEFDLAARGVVLLQPEAAFAQPLDNRPAALAYQSLERTTDELDEGAQWQRLFAPLVSHAQELMGLALADMRSIPKAAFTPTALRFTRRLLTQGSLLWNTGFQGDSTSALLTGVAAHAITPMPSLASAGVSLFLTTIAHSWGWPIPQGGTQKISDALVSDFLAYGGTVQTSQTITDFHQLPSAQAYLFDCTPQALANILPKEAARAYRHSTRNFHYGNAAAKVDYVLNQPVPWSDSRVHAAGTIHIGGTRKQMAEAESLVASGTHAPKPVVLASAPSTVDPTRISNEGLHPLWTYTHVPAGSTQDVTETITAQIERFAPGFRDTIVSAACIPAAHMSAHNANYIGGDIASGAVTMRQMLARPTLHFNPSTTPINGVYLCSASTPPGPGVHAMSGYYCALRVLKKHFNIRSAPALNPENT